MQVEYGLDTSPTPTGSPNVYKTSPASTAEWADVVAIRLHVLARNVEQTSGYTDTKTYQLGLKADGSASNVTPGGAYKRHVFTGVVRVTNVGQRKERPLCRAPTTDCPP